MLLRRSNPLGRCKEAGYRCPLPRTFEGSKLHKYALDNGAHHVLGFDGEFGVFSIRFNLRSKGGSLYISMYPCSFRIPNPPGVHLLGSYPIREPLEVHLRYRLKRRRLWHEEPAFRQRPHFAALPGHGSKLLRAVLSAGLHVRPHQRKRGKFLIVF